MMSIAASTQYMVVLIPLKQQLTFIEYKVQVCSLSEGRMRDGMTGPLK